MSRGFSRGFGRGVACAEQRSRHRRNRVGVGPDLVRRDHSGVMGVRRGSSQRDCGDGSENPAAPLRLVRKPEPGGDPSVHLRGAVCAIGAGYHLADGGAQFIDGDAPRVA